jgi:transposase
MPRGKQKRVPSPGVNRKQTVFGAFCYERGLFYHHIQPRKTAWGVRALLQQLIRRARRTGRRIIMVMDQGNPHHAKALRRHLQEVGEYIEVFWLPYYSPELNLIERLWKHLKCSRMANVLFASFQQFTEHLCEALNDFASCPDFTLSVATRHSHKITSKKLLAGT